ncbi:MAG: hypothetical protein CENE_01673 [Candidatus Celerinatantimonas neptuna]|nr:MAG: hypothetical protein CENE_01673 [Candidatus Celerinatantimonas neptuna]
MKLTGKITAAAFAALIGLFSVSAMATSNPLNFSQHQVVSPADSYSIFNTVGHNK